MTWPKQLQQLVDTWNPDENWHDDPFNSAHGGEALDLATHGGECRTWETRKNASPRCSQFAQAQFGPHLQDGLQLQAFGCLAHEQTGAQVHGLHLHFWVIGKLHWLRWWSSCDTVRAVLVIERSG